MSRWCDIVLFLATRCFYWGTWWSWNNWFFIVYTLGAHGGLAKIEFSQFLHWEVVVVIKELVFDSFYIGTMWWSLKNWFFTLSILGVCGGLERTNFLWFLLWEGLVVLKELIFDSFYIGMMWQSWKNWF